MIAAAMGVPEKGIPRAFATDSVRSVSYALEKAVPLFAEKVKK